ncbi:P-loop NTPase fold protein [Crocosphaera sp. XPORK-15E]|uniref:P-loop NTPase fold protein n=1 Tax=Crocosphaera sp. XPORK-15E TaxID=3110247 RepID=UPI002B21EC4D|nr:P-loop NTPase fold protein [Crocosphaera sp. XPORK-15E]MEA5537128.1 P-loop NTPase fold protein [Crocosphaera sp. XPORK-15E]
MSEGNPSPNEHIKNYLDYYLALPHSPKFAILLKGAWGVGKTWFINQYIHELKSEDKKHLYVSLYGVSNYLQIQNSLFEQLHPILSSKGMAIAGTVFKGLLKASLKIDFDKDGKDDGSLNFSIPDIDFTKFSDDKYSLLIFDDLERCSISIEDVLGYINQFVESGDIKVIIIANEDEIEPKDSQNGQNSKYRRIKEKLIGKTFEIHLDMQGAFKDFLNKLKNEKAKEILSNNFYFIQELYQKGECKNLRILNQVLLEFERIFNKLPEKAQNQPELITDVLEYLIIFFIETSSGKIKIKDISQLKNQVFNENLELGKGKTSKNIQDKNTEEENLLKILCKYNAVSNIFNSDFLLNQLFPSLSWWGILFDKGIVDEKMFNDELPNSKYFQDENTPNWVKLWYFNRHADEEFERLLNKLELEYKDRKFKDIGIIKHITALFLYFSKLGLYNKNQQDIIENAKKYIDELKDSGELDIKYRDDGVGNSYRNLGFMDKDTPEFQEVSNYIEDSQKKLKKSVATDKAKELLEIMKDDVVKFGSIISIKSLPSSNELEEYHYFPIFSYLLPDDFIEAILCLSQEDRRRIFYYIKERFAFLQFPEFSELVKELYFFEKVQELLREESEQKKGKLSGYNLSVLNDKYLNETIDKIKSSTS